MGQHVAPAVAMNFTSQTVKIAQGTIHWRRIPCTDEDLPVRSLADVLASHPSDRGFIEQEHSSKTQDTRASGFQSLRRQATGSL